MKKKKIQLEYVSLPHSDLKGSKIILSSPLLPPALQEGFQIDGLYLCERVLSQAFDFQQLVQNTNSHMRALNILDCF